MTNKWLFVGKKWVNMFVINRGKGCTVQRAIKMYALWILITRQKLLDWVVSEALTSEVRTKAAFFKKRSYSSRNFKNWLCWIIIWYKWVRSKHDLVCSSCSNCKGSFLSLQLQIFIQNLQNYLRRLIVYVQSWLFMH